MPVLPEIVKLLPSVGKQVSWRLMLRRPHPPDGCLGDQVARDLNFNSAKY
jgi:hypothetical protein